MAYDSGQAAPLSRPPRYLLQLCYKAALIVKSHYNYMRLLQLCYKLRTAAQRTQAAHRYRHRQRAQMAAACPSVHHGTGTDTGTGHRQATDRPQRRLYSIRFPFHRYIGKNTVKMINNPLQMAAAYDIFV